MNTFEDLKLAVQIQFEEMSKGELFVTDTNRDDIWTTYLDSFPEGSDPMYKERTEHDCQCCKQFIRAVGNVVAIVDGKLVSIWDIDIGGDYQVVADALANYVKGLSIVSPFLHYEKKVGTDFNHADEDGEVIKWEHFYLELPNKFINKDNAGSVLSDKRSNFDVLYRSLNELTLDSAETILELIEQNSIYRGQENKAIIETFIKLKNEFDNLDEGQESLYCWKTSMMLGGVSKIKNTAIGSLLSDLSDDMDLVKAVKSFEAKLNPQNYKRPTAIITKSMIKKAQDKVEELGIEESLSRRYAVKDDVTINNVLFANRDTKKAMGVFDELAKEVEVNPKNFDKVEEVSIDNFIENILPKATSLELMLENKHSKNMMSLIAPVDVDAPNILKWNNNFSWSYNGEVTDSMKERVKAKGGNIDAELRFSIQWNEENDNPDDLDAHCKEANGNLISYPKKARVQPSSGMLDVDIVNPNGKVAVENITWTNRSKMPKGDYEMLVHCYSSNGAKSGFDAQIEFDGTIHEFSYDKKLKQGQKVKVAVINHDGKGNFTIKPVLKSSAMTREIWNINTQQFHSVDMVMHSPNHWDDQTVGNKHWFFILNECKNVDKSRGFYNEFLKPELNEHRKVFEVLSSKMKTEKSDNQLSGLGFSSTQRNSVLCKVSGKFNRTIKINF